MGTKVRIAKRAWKAEELDGLKPTVYDWARMAAFIDGEGNINIMPYANVKRRMMARIVIVNTDERLMVWLKETFGGTVCMRHHNNPKWKPTYTWSCSAGRAAWVCNNCLPWFIIKDAQAKLLIQFQEHIDETRQSRTLWIPDETLQYRETMRLQLKNLNRKGPIPEVIVGSED